MVQIDNKKMWESLIRQSSLNAGYISVRSIKEALKDQGLKYKDGKIVSIEPEPEPLKIEKDKWYMCIRDFLLADGTIFYKKGVCYQADGRGTFKNERGGWMANWSQYVNKYFRPATEEEIPSAFEQKIQPGRPVHPDAEEL